MEFTENIPVGDVLSVHPIIVDTPESWVWVNGNLYAETLVGYCPNVKKCFAKTSGVNYNEFIQTGVAKGVYSNEPLNSILVPLGNVVIISDKLLRHQVCFIASSTFNIKLDDAYCRSLTNIHTLVNHCMSRYPTVKVTKQAIKAEVVAFTNRALNKLTGFALILSCLVILITSYYNAYKIITGKH